MNSHESCGSCLNRCFTRMADSSGTLWVFSGGNPAGDDAGFTWHERGSFNPADIVKDVLSGSKESTCLSLVHSSMVFKFRKDALLLVLGLTEGASESEVESASEEYFGQFHTLTSVCIERMHPGTLWNDAVDIYEMGPTVTTA